MLRTLSVNFVWISGATIYLAVASPALDSHDRGIDSDRAENQGSLVELSPGEIAALDFNDDGDPKTSGANTAAVTKPHRKTATPDSIEAALHNSLEYYLELPTETLFRFGPRPADVYSVREMIASCSLFLKIVRTPDAKRRERGLRRRFRVFESRNAAGATHYTGYYTPRLIGSRRPRAPADVPVHGPPRDLVRVDPGRFVSEYSGPPIHGRVHKGRLIQYFTQSEILFTRAVAENQPLFYLNAADYYHLQLQGGALIKLEPDSDASTGAPKSDESQAADNPSAVYYEYAADNGRDFQSPGKKFSAPRSRLRRLADANPKAFKEGLAKNPRYIFFREQSSGPSGSLKRPLTPGRSIAMDTSLIRGGVPAFVLSSSRTHTLRRFAVVQDTGNAIRGHGRVDFYWGDDAAAERRATRFKQSGRVFLFVARK